MGSGGLRGLQNRCLGAEASKGWFDSDPPPPSAYNRAPMAALPWFFPALAFVFGALVGSFLNVVIHRYPLEESIVFPPSKCPHCQTKIKPWDNVPILSWLLLLGRCRACRAPISIRYPVVELANGLFWMAAFLRTGLTPAFAVVAALTSMWIVLIYIDLDVQILPDVINYPGILLGLLIGWMQWGLVFPDLQLSISLFESAIGAAVGSGLLFTIALAYKLWRKVEGMGLGDVKMMAMLGAVFGWEPLFPLLVIASVTGALVGGIVAMSSTRGMQVPIPFGVFLGIAALVVLFFGPTLWTWYLVLLQP